MRPSGRWQEERRDVLRRDGEDGEGKIENRRNHDAGAREIESEGIKASKVVSGRDGRKAVADSRLGRSSRGGRRKLKEEIAGLQESIAELNEELIDLGTTPEEARQLRVEVSSLETQNTTLRTNNARLRAAHATVLEENAEIVTVC